MPWVPSNALFGPVKRAVEDAAKGRVAAALKGASGFGGTIGGGGSWPINNETMPRIRARMHQPVRSFEGIGRLSKTRGNSGDDGEGSTLWIEPII